MRPGRDAVPLGADPEGASGEGLDARRSRAERAAILGAIEHTYLRPEGAERAVARLCDEAVAWGLAAVCVNPAYVAFAAHRLAGTGVRVVTVCGFPLGASRTEVKAREAALAAEDGAHEVDMVINVGWLKEGNHDRAGEDVRAVVQAAGIPVKVILECALLTPEETVAGCRLAAEAGAAFVKTATGFGPGGATEENVRLLRQTVPPGMGVKAAGGIRSLEQVQALLQAGADRIGTSHGAAIAALLAGYRPGVQPHTL